jgi:hypothetical protein
MSSLPMDFNFLMRDQCSKTVSETSKLALQDRKRPYYVKTIVLHATKEHHKSTTLEKTLDVFFLWIAHITHAVDSICDTIMCETCDYEFPIKTGLAQL